MAEETSLEPWIDASYVELRRLAAAWLRGTPSAASIQPTSLVHEAYVRLARMHPETFADRAHFVAVAATAMRQILVDRSRRRRAQKRGNGDVAVPLDEGQTPPESRGLVDAVEIDNALTQLARLSERQAQVAEMRVFGGATMPEIATVLAVSLSTVEADWRLARAWLRREFGR